VGWSYTVAASRSDTAHSTLPRMADFFLFDTLSGGAGYATQIGQHLESLLSLTQDILTDCPDHCERSCYRCLRTYVNRILHSHLDRRLGGTLLQAIISGYAPVTPTVEQQAMQLEMLRQFLELAGVACEREGMLREIKVPLLAKTGYETYAIGSYPVQQERQMLKHPLEILPGRQVRLFSDYELAHNLPHVARSLLD